MGVRSFRDRMRIGTTRPAITPTCTTLTIMAERDALRTRPSRTTSTITATDGDRRTPTELDALTDTRPRWTILLGLGLAGGLLPDPGALALLLAAIASGRPVTGLLTVLVFSIGFALVLVVVGVVAARVGQLVLTWLSGRWILWLQLGTALLILAVGVGLSFNAWRVFAALT